MSELVNKENTLSKEEYSKTNPYHCKVVLIGGSSTVYIILIYIIILNNS
ncbi:MAG: hypothetical protein MJ252_10450 [archaeon]|nr:hypothetical protein [archaeon]